MKHGVKKIQFRKGQDATQAMVRKLIMNFLRNGYITTTDKRAKVIKAQIDRLVHKAQKATAADKNVILSRTNSKDAVTYLVDTVAKNFKRNTGFTTLEKFGPRQGDSAEMVKVSWIKDIRPMRVKASIVDEKAEKEVKPAKEVKETKKVKKTVKK